MKKLISIFLFCFLAAALFAQTPVPEDYELSSDADFVKYQEDALNCMEWLMNTNLDQDREERIEVNRFVWEWLNGTSSVSIVMNESIINFADSNPDLLMIYMCGWAKYSIESQDKSKIRGTLKGIETVLEFYKNNKRFLKKDKNVENYKKMQQNGTLEDFVIKNA